MGAPVVPRAGRGEGGGGGGGGAGCQGGVGRWGGATAVPAYAPLHGVRRRGGVGDESRSLVFAILPVLVSFSLSFP